MRARQRKREREIVCERDELTHMNDTYSYMKYMCEATNWARVCIKNLGIVEHWEAVATNKPVSVQY